MSGVIIKNTVQKIQTHLVQQLHVFVQWLTFITYKKINTLILLNWNFSNLVKMLLLGPHDIKTIFYNLPKTVKQVTGPS